jgi:hypothetical protein
VGGQDYEIETVTGFYHNYIDTLEDQVWWGDPSLAMDFSNTLRGSMGTRNGGYASPYAPAFGYSVYDGVGADYMRVFAYWPDYCCNALDNRALGINAGAGIYWTYAVATPITQSPVPIPAAAWLFGSALLGLGALKRRKPQPF